MTVHAGHPLIGEDTATQGSGGFELGPQLSYGILPQLDAILRPIWRDQRSTIDGAVFTLAALATPRSI